MKRVVAVACAAFGLVPAQHAASQGYPERPIRIVVSFPPGGSTDFSARILAAHLPRALGQSVVVDNRAGAAGNIGTDIAAKAVPDGYTLLVTAEAPITINPGLYAKLPFVAMRDLTAITQLIKYANVLVLNPSVRAGSIKELIALAKAQPGKLSYGHPGIGTVPHLCAELFKIATGIDVVGISYKGGGPVMVGLLGNEAQLSFATPPSSIPHVKTGKLKAIAVTTTARSAALPDLPTIAESGVAGFHVEGWVALFAPARTPEKVIARLHEEAAKVMRLPEVKEAVLASGSETSGNTPREANTIVREETAMWAKVIKSAGVRIE